MNISSLLDLLASCDPVTLAVGMVAACVFYASFTLLSRAG